MVGVFLPETSPLGTGDVQMLEDEVEYQEKKGSQLQMDNCHNLVYPSFYYNDQTDCKTSAKIMVQKSTQKACLVKNDTVNQGYPNNGCENGKPFPLLNPPVNSVTAKHSSDDEDEVTISDTESDSSVDPDWDDLRRPSELLPLIHMQLFSGAWPLVRPFSYAVGVPLDEIRKLPLRNEYIPSHSIAQQTFSSSDMEDETKAHFWTTALAITCFEEYFAHLPSEWELVAFKGKIWLEQNHYQCNLTMDEVYHIARRLVLKQS